MNPFDLNQCRAIEYQHRCAANGGGSGRSLAAAPFRAQHQHITDIHQARTIHINERIRIATSIEDLGQILYADHTVAIEIARAGSASIVGLPWCSADEHAPRSAAI
ncbi:MAG: hypothetical protein QGG74_06350 [Phycisphaerales bacterium]|nr:hypothetical protein [Phycisphaerales bacterium]